MNDQVKCPHCGKVFAMNQAILHLVEKEKSKFEEERKKLREEAQKWRELQQKKFDDQSQQKAKEIEQRIKEKLKEETELQMKDKSNEIGELRKQFKTSQDQLLELSRLNRQLRSEKEQGRIELEKKLVNEQEKIRSEEKKRVDEEYHLKILEKDKQMNDMRKQIEELKRKSEIGSQQLQGDVMEIELKNILKREFPFDEIKDVSTGIRGADVLQMVKNNYGKSCGIIVWESKRTKSWTDSWIAKLKEDKRQVKADIAVIISQVLPSGIKHFAEKNGVLIGSFEMITIIGLLLRNKLIDIAMTKSSFVGREGKKEILWNYFTGKEFIQKLEAISDAYTQLQIDLETEKRWFIRKWSKQEKNIRAVIDNILGMHGDLQHIVGRDLPEIKELDVLPDGKNEKKEGLF